MEHRHVSYDQPNEPGFVWRRLLRIRGAPEQSRFQIERALSMERPLLFKDSKLNGEDVVSEGSLYLLLNEVVGSDLVDQGT
jgi:hypothetical protein